MIVRLRKFLLIFLFVFSVSCVDATQSQRITILHFNDVYQVVSKDGKGGLGKMMTLLKQQREQYPDSITIVSGDFLFPSVLSSMTEGQHMIYLLNALGVDLVVFGNHEFDFGPKILLKRIIESEFTWLGTNTLRKEDGKPYGGSVSVDVRKINDVNVGFLGVLSPEAAQLSQPGKDVIFTDPILEGNKAVGLLKEQGAQLMIALTHMDFLDDVKFAQEVKGLHLILGGHDHDPITWEEGGVLIQKSGVDGHYLGVIHINVYFDDKGSILRVIPEWSMISTAEVVPDPEVQDEIDRYVAWMNKKLQGNVGKTLTDLDSRRHKVRSQESSMGNLVTDAMREHFKADAALMNGGGIRGDRLYPAGTELSTFDIASEFPFGDRVTMVELNGSDLLRVLEHGVSKREMKAGRFPQVSGLRFNVDPKAPAGSRVKQAWVSGEILNPNQSYHLVIGTYLLTGGDGYEVLSNAKVLIEEEPPLISQVVGDYLKRYQEVSPIEEGRIRFLK